MNSDLMPSPESSNTSASSQAQTTVEAGVDSNTPAIASELSSSPVTSNESSSCEANRQQPIPPPSEPMQYRAIGLVRGRYRAGSEQFTQGTLLTADGTELNAVLLGRIMSLVKNHLDLDTEHLWVVYPRTRQENDQLHIQIVGVWEPENLAKQLSDEQNLDSESQEDDETTEDVSPEETPQELDNSLQTSSEIPDRGFSVRGEVVYQSFDAGSLVVKIKQAARKDSEKPKYFKLKLRGKLDTKAVGKFWDFQVKREADVLVVEHGEAIADLPRKRRPPMKGGGGRRPFNKGGGGGRKPYPPRKNGETPRPVKKTSDSSAASQPGFTRPTPKPVKRPKEPPQES